MSSFKRTGRKGLSVLLALGILLSAIVAMQWPASAAPGDIKVYIDLEGYNLGQGYYIEPVQLELTLGSTAADALLALFAQESIMADIPDYGEWGLYLSAIKDLDDGTVDIPSYITGVPGFELHGLGNPDDWLGDGDYTSMSGWMYTVNHTFGTGMSSQVLKEGDVLRWQFSVWGYGLDLGVDNGFGYGDPYYEHADKSYLIRLLFAAGANQANINAALDVVIDPLASEAEVAAAEDALLGDAGIALASCNKLTAPTEATVSVVLQPGYYQYNTQLPITARGNGGGTKTWYYGTLAAANTMWRAEIPGKVTQSGWGLSAAGVTADFTNADDPKNPATNNLANRESGSMLLNINASNFLQLPDPGDTYRLYAMRAWEIINSDTINKEITPDFTYEFLENDDVVELVPDDDLWLNYRSTITALQEGTAILEITYDAIDVGGAGHVGRYGATNPQRKGLAVITVGDIAAGDVLVQRPWNAAATGWDSESDTWYFVGGSEEIVIEPTAANVTSVQAWNPDAQGDWADVTDNKLTLYPGNNIVKVTVLGGLSYYKVIRGNTIQIQAVSAIGDRPLMVGDQVRLLWGGDIPAYPIPKLSGIYNPGNYTLYSAWDDTITITQDMVDRGILYANGTSIWPNSTDDNTGSSGYREILTTNNAFSAAAGRHRVQAALGANATSPNAGVNGTYPNDTKYYNVIPSVHLTDYFPADPVDITVTMQLDNDGFYIARQEITVEPDLSETYGFVDEYNGGAVTAVDAFIAAHIAIFGDEDIEDYITVSSGSYLYAFAENGWFSCSVNGEYPGDGVFVYDSWTGTDQQWGYALGETLIADGDDVFFYGTQDSMGIDYVTWFEQDGEKVEAITAEAGEDIDLALMGFMGWYFASSPADQAALTEEVYDADIVLVEIVETPGLRSATFEAITETDDYGEFTLNFDEPGAYIVSAVEGWFDYPFMSPWLEITVTQSLAAAKHAKIALIEAVDDALTEANYTPQSWAALQAAIAQAIADVNAATTIAEVDAVALPTTSGLVTKTTSPGTATSLAAAKAAKIAAINAVTNGLKEADYTPGSWAALQAAITQAIAAVNAATTVAAVNAVALPSTGILVPIAGDLAAAKAAKIAAINAVTNGLNEADYTPESWAALQSAITQAIAGVNAAETVAAVNAVGVPATAGLVTKEAELDSAKAAKIAEINALIDGLNAADYTPESWALLQAAIAQAIADVTAATAVAGVSTIALPTKDGLVKAKLTCLQKWETKLPKWLSWIPPLWDWSEWVIMIVFFGWIWWLF